MKAIIVDHNRQTIDLDDILNEEFMPMSIFESEKNKYLVDGRRNLNNITNIQTMTNGDIMNAYDLMTFHR